MYKINFYLLIFRKFTIYQPGIKKTASITGSSLLFGETYILNDRCYQSSRFSKKPILMPRYWFFTVVLLVLSRSDIPWL